jgi:hypothetical protein
LNILQNFRPFIDMIKFDMNPRNVCLLSLIKKSHSNQRVENAISLDVEHLKLSYPSNPFSAFAEWVIDFT